MAANSHTGTVKIIAPHEYPPMITGEGAANFLRVLTSYETAQRAARVIELRRDQLCEAVLSYIAQMEDAASASNLSGIFAQAHEIRGLAGTAGMEAAGRIADGLCKYLSAAADLGSVADAAVIALHVDAITRASSSAGEAGKFGNRVAVELATLVARKLNAVNGLKTKSA
ncbi:MAG TPA: Hpt domain-containing protein [Rhizomicrobium sp.]